MKWKLNGIGFKITAAMRQHAQHCVLGPLSRLRRHIRTVAVSVRRGAGAAQGGGQVQAVVTLADGRTFAVNHEGDCYYATLNVMADRLKEAIRRRVERRESARKLRKKRRA